MCGVTNASRHGVDVANIVRKVLALCLSSGDRERSSRKPDQLIEIQPGAEKEKVAIGGPLLLNAAYGVSLIDAIVGEERNYSKISQFCKLSINHVAETQHLNRFLDRLGRSTN